MLVLSRKKGERIVIGDNVELVVVDVRGDRIRLGIVAPRDVPVRRSELRDSRVNPQQGRPDRGVKVA